MAGALELLCHLHDVGVRAGIVSNALSGAVTRELVREYGFETLLGIQVYSNEVGMRKPHPGIFRLAADALGVDLASCWYVGDTWDRDVVGGRRAGVGKVILMQGSETAASGSGPRPDHIVTSPRELQVLLNALVPA
jgi:FMN phosphatase YigB (HAD superfamily)